MVHTKFQKIFRVFTIYGRSGHVGHVTMSHRSFFVPLTSEGTSEIWLQFGLVVSESFEIVGRRR